MGSSPIDRTMQKALHCKAFFVAVFGSVHRSVHTQALFGLFLGYFCPEMTFSKAAALSLAASVKLPSVA